MALANLSTSKFYVDIKNELGLPFKKVRGDLLALSLAKPQYYYELRNEIIQVMTEAQVESMYNIIWRILRNGQKPNNDPITYRNPLTGAKDVRFIPALPEHLVGSLASKAARTIEDLFEDIIEEILPDDYLKLSHNRQKQVLSAKGLMDE